MDTISLCHASGLCVSLHPFGASWTACQIPLDNGRREILLGCRPADLPRQSVYLGATVGRYANRIANARYTLNGKTQRLSANQDGKHTLHGGADNWAYRTWGIIEQSPEHVTFCLDSPDGDQGFGGHLTAMVTYTLTANRLTIDYRVESKQLSICAMTNHAYFNLDGVGKHTADARQQRLTLPAQYFLPVAADGIPNAKLNHVEQTPFDFRHGKTIAQDFTAVCQQHPVSGYDHAYYFGDNGKHKTAAVLQSADQRLLLTLGMTQAALHLYSGNFLHNTTNRDGGIYDNHNGIALEPGCLPDSPNHPDYLSDCLVSPDNPQHHQMVYTFAWR